MFAPTRLPPHPAQPPPFAAAASSPAASRVAPDRSARLRQQLIRQARETVLFDDRATPLATVGVEGWIERSWRRCLAQGQRPEHEPVFNALSSAVLGRTLDANRPLLQAAGPVLETLSQAIADTRYFAILTNHDGVVVDARGAIDRSDPRADLITRVGTDLSEAALGTTAISAALAELQPVWLHQGEHFFNANAAYSCAGAPLFGPHGQCVGMLDVTGIHAVERPELRHLLSQAARRIENQLTLSQLDAGGTSRGLLLRLNWPGSPLGDDTDGLVVLDREGMLCGANQAARQMVPQLAAPGGAVSVHSGEVFAVDVGTLFDAARRSSVVDVPLWTGLRLQALPQTRTQMDATHHRRWGDDARTTLLPMAKRPLRELETALIRQAVLDARGNVVQAAKALGVSRATVYRRLGHSSVSS
jgi:sigma-54 dependent transcriptional regulator, acetoin dehydrogenase operon transcriptional activator AcoR